MVGVERSALPVLAESEFGIASAAATLSFLVPFGLTKAAANLVAGDLAGRVGRRRILLLGWLFGLPVPFLLAWAPSWAWVNVANVLLGVNQGLAWSATVIMKIDLVGPARRGLAMGLNEFAGYLAVSLAALGAGYLASAYGPRPAPYLIGVAAAISGLGLSLVVRDTAAHVAREHDEWIGREPVGAAALPRSFVERLRHASWSRRPLFAANQAGFVNNLNDGVAWGLLPLYFAAGGLGLREIGWLAGLYPGVWAAAQLLAGTVSDRWGRRPFIAGGMFVQAVALALFALSSELSAWVFAAALLGLGTAAVYPTLIAQVSDLVRPQDRAGAVGVYRLWRDLGYPSGALLGGFLADLVGFRPTIVLVALLTAASGVVAGRLLAHPATT
ncbi:MAG: MFS transporter [Gemmatimonadetes bacterium]|nr:MFS transporter [Gemmatimonadota bacterium]